MTTHIPGRHERTKAITQTNPELSDHGPITL